MSNKIFGLFALCMLCLGLCIGYFLSIRTIFSPSNVLNLIGILYSIIAVLILYESFTEQLGFRTKIVSLLAPLVLWIHTIIPLGITVSWVLTREAIHGSEVSQFGFSLFLYSLLPLLFLEGLIVNPVVGKWKAIGGRHRRFGLYLLLSGLVFQLFAAFISL